MVRLEDWRKLTPEESAHRCRLMAKDAMARATASPLLAGFYLDIADDWRKLATEFEKSSALPN